MLTCASFAARAAGHVIEARYLDDPTSGSPLPKVVPPPPPPTVPPDGRGRQASAFVARNPFCSACTSTGDPASLSDAIAATHLPLVLVATSLGTTPFASIRNLETGGQGAFHVGDAVPGAGTIDKIGGTFVWLRSAAGAIERLDLLAIAAATPAPVAPPTGAPDDAPAWSARVRKIDDVTYEVDRELVRELVGAGASAKVPGVRITPATGKDGKLRGVRISRASKDSLAAGLGLRTGDVIESIDGRAIDSPDALLEAYGRLDSAAQVRLSLSRGGKPAELDFRLR